jgi:hypothetical protein
VIHVEDDKKSIVSNDDVRNPPQSHDNDGGAVDAIAPNKMMMTMTTANL